MSAIGPPRRPKASDVIGRDGRRVAIADLVHERPPNRGRPWAAARRRRIAPGRQSPRPRRQMARRPGRPRPVQPGDPRRPAPRAAQMVQGPGSRGPQHRGFPPPGSGQKEVRASSLTAASRAEPPSIRPRWSERCCRSCPTVSLSRVAPTSSSVASIRCHPVSGAAILPAFALPVMRDVFGVKAGLPGIAGPASLPRRDAGIFAAEPCAGLAGAVV